MVVNGANAYPFECSQRQDNLVGIQVNSTATDFVMVSRRGLRRYRCGNRTQRSKRSVHRGGRSRRQWNVWHLAEERVRQLHCWLLSESNGIAGVYLGCNAAGPNGTACPAGSALQQRQLSHGLCLRTSTNSLVSNTGSPLNQRFGIAVGLGNRHNHFLVITGAGNVDEDALDENPSCGNNRWFADTFTTSSPAKNTTFFCLN